MKVFAREREQEKIRSILSSGKPELVAVYGRRRVGKTFTISQTLKENSAAVYFQLTGNLREDGKPVPQRNFLIDFSVAWYGCTGTNRVMHSVRDCLIALVDLCAMGSETKPLYLFLDELPWLAKSSPDFFRSFVTLWNNTLSKNPYLKLFVAGSATSWMIDRIIQAKTGLAKRVTAKIYMQALSLRQTQEFLAGKGMRLHPNDLFRIYSALGGIPYYLDAVDASISPTQNIYNLLVRKEGLLHADTEYAQLFRYLFSDDPSYMQVIDKLVGKKYGLSLQEIAKAVERKSTSSSRLRNVLQNLEYSDLIEKKSPFLNRAKGMRYFVTDEYVRFVSRWLKNSSIESYGEFNEIFSSPSYSSWQGFDFELILFKNMHLVTEALGIAGISAQPHIYYQDGKVQIDLLLARGDQTITICEAKSCDSEYQPTEKDVECFTARKQAIADLLKTKRKPHQYINYCFIVRNGIKRNRNLFSIEPLVVDLSKVLGIGAD